MGIVTWASAKCELLPKLEEPFLVGSSQLDKIMEMVYWLIRTRMVNECFVLNNTNLAAIMTNKFSGEYLDIKNSLPPWVLFFNIAGYDYFPEKKINAHIHDIKEIAQRVGLEVAQVIGEVSAYKLLKATQRPCEDPY
jgi:hypothetical protein